MAPPTVSEISRLDLQNLDTDVLASITDVKPLSSYNWIGAPKGTPTIAVPGCPDLWSAPTAPRRLPKDSGLIYIAQNAARHPEYPLEPLFRALYTTHPSFNIHLIDIVTDRNCIRKLLSFVDPSSNKNAQEAFNMSIELTRNTAIFCREEAKLTEYIGPHQHKGFGHEFEKAYTIPLISGGTGHHRIISYCFGGLKFLVRHETDGYIETDTKIIFQADTGAEADLADKLGELSLSSEESSETNPGSKLVTRRQGQSVPLESTLEIKTRVSHRPIQIPEVAAQLWVSQTPKLVRAYHQNGLFQVPEVKDVTAEIKSWEERKQNQLRMLAGLIRKVIETVKDCGGKAALRYDVPGKKLVIRKTDRKEMLPKDLYLKWDDCEVEGGAEGQDAAAQETEAGKTVKSADSDTRDHPGDTTKEPPNSTSGE